MILDKNIIRKRFPSACKRCINLARRPLKHKYFDNLLEKICTNCGLPYSRILWCKLFGDDDGRVTKCTKCNSIIKFKVCYFKDNPYCMICFLGLHDANSSNESR
jgi:hypothetical protein